MILHINAKIKALNWKPDAESVIQLEANLRPSEVQQIAAFGGTELVVQILKQQSDMFDYAAFGGQPGLFDQVDLPEATGPQCTKCGGELQELVCLSCGQRHREPSSLVEKQEPVLCGLPARFSLAAVDSRGEHVAAIDLCEGHLEAADPEHSGELDDAPEGATCDWILTEEEIAEREEVPPAEDTCICDHNITCHGAPGEKCSHDGCDCTIFRSAAEAAERADAEHEADPDGMEVEMMQDTAEASR